MQVVPYGGQICNYCKWCHLVVIFATNASGAIWWPYLQLMQVAPSAFAINAMLLPNLIQVYGVNLWVRCASGNVFTVIGFKLFWVNNQMLELKDGQLRWSKACTDQAGCFCESVWEKDKWEFWFLFIKVPGSSPGFGTNAAAFDHHQMCRKPSALLIINDQQTTNKQGNKQTKKLTNKPKKRKTNTNQRPCITERFLSMNYLSMISNP